MNKSWAYKVLVCARVLFLCVCAALVGGVTHSLMMGQVETITEAAQSERIAKNETQIRYNEIELASLRETVARQDREISEMHGIGIGLGSILLILQVIQMAAGRLMGRSTRRE